MSKEKVDLKTVYDLKNPPFQKCPYCGCEEFYVNVRISGFSRFNFCFDGSDTYNGELFDSVDVRKNGVYAYCKDCEKRLFRYRDKS